MVCFILGCGTERGMHLMYINRLVLHRISDSFSPVSSSRTGRYLMKHGGGGVEPSFSPCPLLPVSRSYRSNWSEWSAGGQKREGEGREMYLVYIHVLTTVLYPFTGRPGWRPWWTTEFRMYNSLLFSLSLIAWWAILLA